MLESLEDHAVEFNPLRRVKNRAADVRHAKCSSLKLKNECKFCGPGGRSYTASRPYFRLTVSRLAPGTLAHARPKHFGTQARQAVRVIALNVGDEFLADLAAKIERFRGIGGRREDAQLHGLVGGIGYLEIPEAFIPQMACFDDSFQRLPGLFDGQ